MQDKKWSQAYDTGKDFRPLFPVDLEKILALLPTDSQKTHLDIGCGTGGLTRDMFHRGYQSTGIDVSASAIDLAKRATMFNNNGLRYIHANFEDMPPHNTLYSVVTCKLVYAFLQDKSQSIRKIKSLLNTNGAFVLITKVHHSKDDATPISVNENETRDILAKNFDTVKEIDLEWATCFICTANSVT